MSLHAQAIVFTGENQVEIQSHEVPDLRPTDVLVRTEYSGVSQGTEVWALTGRRPELTFPTVPGYQSIGVIEQVGAEVEKFAVGQRVLFSASRLPDSFPYTWMGAHVSHAVVSTLSHVILPLAAGTDPVAAAISTLPAVSLRGLNMLKINIGDLVVVTGQGLIGQGSAQLARLRGATVLTTDIGEKRLALSRANGADAVVNVREQDLSEVVQALRPEGADVVIETTGRSDQFAPCIDIMRQQGQLLLQGWYPQPISFDFQVTHSKRPTIAITCGFDADELATCLEMMAQGKLHLRELVTHLAPVSEAPGIYRQLASNDPEMLGVVFDWGGG